MREFLVSAKGAGPCARVLDDVFKVPMHAPGEEFPRDQATPCIPQAQSRPRFRRNTWRRVLDAQPPWSDRPNDLACQADDQFDGLVCICQPESLVALIICFDPLTHFGSTSCAIKRDQSFA